ncbi:MAG TPA: hypothetical protein PKN56_19560 [Leptospiraceae bacterium]|nr:hypothetical protein [Leptospiraceae bacterium]HNO22609.1 hypothetical protein [Leptospiraceae bacterium]
MQKRKKKSKVWREITEQKTEFQGILKVLNRFYEAVAEDRKNDSHRFRKSLEKENTEKFRIFLRKFGKYEFLVYAEIRDTETGSRSDSWIHIDGIAEEREQLRKKGNHDHPVFSISCLTDLYLKSSVSAPEFPEELKV